MQDVNAFDIIVSYPTESRDKKTTTSQVSKPTPEPLSAEDGISTETEEVENAIVLEDDGQQAILASTSSAVPQPSPASASSSIFPMLKNRIINTLVFPVGAKVGSKKTLTFKRKNDFTVKMAYKNPPAV